MAALTSLRPVAAALVVVVGCRAAPPPPPAVVAARVPSPPAEPAVVPSASAAASTAPPPEAPLCELEVVRLDDVQRTAPAKLGDVLGSTTFVTVVVPVLDEADCSGVGWRHLAFAPFDPGANDGLIRAYRAQHLPAPAPESAPFYLMGGTLEAARVVDLKKVCVSFESEVNARVDWVLPLPDRDAALRWSQRLAGTVCGRQSAACRGCSLMGSDGCGRVETDSCPGPMGRYSTCAGVFPCEARCCD